MNAYNTHVAQIVYPSLAVGEKHWKIVRLKMAGLGIGFKMVGYRGSSNLESD